MIVAPLDKLETAAALSAVRAVQESMKNDAPAQIAAHALGADNPLTKAEAKLASNLDKFKGPDEIADAWYTLYDYIEGCDDFTDEQCEAIDTLSAWFLENRKED